MIGGILVCQESYKLREYELRQGTRKVRKLKKSQTRPSSGRTVNRHSREMSRAHKECAEKKQRERRKEKQDSSKRKRNNCSGTSGH